jgi:hypothetical protein
VRGYAHTTALPPPDCCAPKRSIWETIPDAADWSSRAFQTWPGIQLRIRRMRRGFGPAIRAGCLPKRLPLFPGNVDQPDDGGMSCLGKALTNGGIIPWRSRQAPRAKSGQMAVGAVADYRPSTMSLCRPSYPLKPARRRGWIVGCDYHWVKWSPLTIHVQRVSGFATATLEYVYDSMSHRPCHTLSTTDNQSRYPKYSVANDRSCHALFPSHCQSPPAPTLMGAKAGLSGPPLSASLCTSNARGLGIWLIASSPAKDEEFTPPQPTTPHKGEAWDVRRLGPTSGALGHPPQPRAVTISSPTCRVRPESAEEWAVGRGPWVGTGIAGHSSRQGGRVEAGDSG